MRWMVAALCVTAVAALILAQAPVLNLTATTANVSGAPESIRIQLLRWSTDAERQQLWTAWTQPNAPPPGTKAGGRAAKSSPPPDDDPAVAGNDRQPPAAKAAKGKGKAKGGGGGGRGPAAPQTPEGALAAALGRVPTLGYLWSSENAGYAIHSAVQLEEPGGGRRILLLTNRRLGAWNDRWKPSDSTYGFSLIELRLNAQGQGEGKISLTGKIAADSAAQTFALENYEALPVVLKDVTNK
jgi:hypothetical protein